LCWGGHSFLSTRLYWKVCYKLCCGVFIKISLYTSVKKKHPENAHGPKFDIDVEFLYIDTNDEDDVHNYRGYIARLWALALKTNRLLEFLLSWSKRNHEARRAWAIEAS
jgi:hypothetical protein